MNTCFFIGHRDTGSEVHTALADEVEHHITSYNVTSFFVGHYGNFDRMAAAAVIKAKKHHPEVTLTLLLPYHPFDRPIPQPEGFDGTFYPPGMERVPKRFAIVRANRYMLEHSTHLIAHVWHISNGSREIWEAAQKRKALGLICVTNLADTTQRML